MLAGCESVSKTLGMTHHQPDAMLVDKNPPLSIPENYRLVKPTPGARNPFKSTPEEEAKKLLGYENPKGTSSAKAETHLVSGIEKKHKAEANIRELVDKDANINRNVPDKLVDAVTSWRKQLNDNFGDKKKSNKANKA